MSLPVVLLLVAGLLAVVSLMQRLASRLTLPASILFAGMGVAIGAAATFAMRSDLDGPIGELARVFVNVPVTSETFLYVFVPALLFQGALTLDVRRIIEDSAPIFLLAVVAVIVATAVIGVAIAPIAGVSLVACLLLASIVATTDSVAVISIFRDVGAPARLCRLVEGESLLNDAAAIVAFTVLLDILLGGQGAGFGSATLAFVWSMAGGLAAGYIGARLVVAVLPWLQDLRLAQVTLTLALPYLVFIIGERALGVSGVIAAVMSGLVMSAIGQPRIAPADWKFLLDMWEQLAYWASSLIFVLAALLVPRLLLDTGWWDVLVLTVLIAAALAARALVLWGFFPILSRFSLSQHVGHRFNVVILWGGLRGAVTLALALAVTENAKISYDVQRFVAVQATGFVLFTLLVPGLTLRRLIRWLGLDALSPFDQAMRAQVLALSRQRVVDAVRRIGTLYRFPDDLVARVARTYGAGPATDTGSPRPSTLAGAREEDQLRLGLVALTQRERQIILEHFAARTLSGRIVEELLTDAGQVLDKARTRGPEEYLKTAHALVGFSRWFKAALLLHRRFHIDGPLVDRLADRFERLLVGRIVLDELVPCIDETLAPIVSASVTARLRGVVAKRQEMTAAALEALGAQYPEYAALLEQRFLHRVALRHEDVEYRALFDEQVIGPELYGALQRDVQTARAAVYARPALDLGLETRALLARVPMFAALTREELDRVAHLLQPRFALPDERLISVGDPGDSMYFISAGVVEVTAADRQILLTRGDFFGEMALLLHQPRQADVTARTYCQLLVLEQKDFQALQRSSKTIRAQIDRAAAERTKMNRAAAD